MCVAADQDELLNQIGSALATGNVAVISSGALRGLPDLADNMAGCIREAVEPQREDVAAVLFSGTAGELQTCNQAMAERVGQIVPVYIAQPGGAHPLEWLVQEQSVSTNTTAAGGNANLMMIG